MWEEPNKPNNLWDSETKNNNYIVENMSNVPVELYSNDIVENLSLFIKEEEEKTNWIIG